ncbi:uncharacterized protein LOC114254534 [Monomorium pharaonis]|uniref:uncharacterized protein LOC114254534 n=1 Tax=Monomorium pharaonis TaxID=307658 RepID=UPI001745ECA8|nr:uncharacterized protein LOC114254534 [Monomorium pharaonis]
MLFKFFLFYCIIITHGFRLQEALDTAGCLTFYKNKSYRNDCLQLTGEFEAYPRTREKADANIALHCRGINMLVIKHNPGSYIIQPSTTVDTWGIATVSKDGFSTFSNLIPDTLYRYRLHRITQHGFSLPETSDWFSTYAVDYQPRSVEHISLVKIKEESKNVCQLRAEIIFKPSEDQSCNYNILSWSQEHDLINFDLRKVSVVRVLRLYKCQAKRKGNRSLEWLTMQEKSTHEAKTKMAKNKITIPVFDEENYAMWKKRITTYLKFKNCAEVITREKAPGDTSTRGENDLKAINYIYSAISDKQLECGKTRHMKKDCHHGGQADKGKQWRTINTWLRKHRKPLHKESRKGTRQLSRQSGRIPR